MPSIFTFVVLVSPRCIVFKVLRALNFHGQKRQGAKYMGKKMGKNGEITIWLKGI